MNDIAAILKFILLILQGLSAFAIVGLVLVHSPKGDGFGAMGGTGQVFSSQKSAESALNKLTGITAGLFFLVSFVLGYYF
ncbi:MAG: preprotein translocase subunit SecG [Cyanobacteria bacterium P01_H01_bin.74]